MMCLRLQQKEILCLRNVLKKVMKSGKRFSRPINLQSQERKVLSEPLRENIAKLMILVFMHAAAAERCYSIQGLNLNQEQAGQASRNQLKKTLSPIIRMTHTEWSELR